MTVDCHVDIGLKINRVVANYEIDGVDNVENCGKVIIQTAAV